MDRYVVIEKSRLSDGSESFDVVVNSSIRFYCVDEIAAIRLRDTIRETTIGADSNDAPIITF